MEINGKVAIVTGGASGLGLAIVEMLIKNGAKVAVLDINNDLLSKLNDHENLLKITCDVTDELSIAHSVNMVIDKFSCINILVNNAGILHSEPLINIMATNRRHNPENWKKVIDINLTAPFILTSYVTEQMILSRTKGVIVNISSISARGNAGQSAYSAAKAGLESMSKVWTKELGNFGIRSVAIAPGFMDTESTRLAVNNKMLEEIQKLTPIKKLGHAEDVASAVIFMIENEFMNGKILNIDGGLVV